MHAAPVAGQIDIVITDNTADLTVSDDDPFEVLTADDFLVLVDDAAAAAVRNVTVEQYRYWVNRDGSRSLPDQLRQCGAARFASRVEQHLKALGLPTATL